MNEPKPRFTKLVKQARRTPRGVNVLLTAYEADSNNPTFWGDCLAAAKVCFSKEEKKRNDGLLPMPIPEDFIFFAPKYDEIIDVCRQKSKLLDEPKATKPVVTRKSNCTTEYLRRDLSELCKTCSLRKSIPEGIEAQIVASATTKKELSSPAEFAAYITAEKQNAFEAIERTNQYETANLSGLDQYHRGGLTEIFIWNKERIKALDRVAGDQQVEVIKQRPLTTTQKRLKLFLARPKGITANDFYREVAKAVPKEDGNPPKFKTIGTKYNEYKNGDKQESKDIIELIVSELEAEGRPIDRDFLELIRRYWY